MSPASYDTQDKIHSVRIKEEITFLHLKKDKLNKQLYYAHLKATQEWGKSWHITRNSIHDSINNEMDRKYNTINHKLNKLGKTQTSTPKHHKKF
jgi:hypothetical protein